MDYQNIHHKIRIMCSNWYFTHFPEEVKKLGLKEYKDLRNNLEYKVENHEQYKVLVEPLIEKYHLLEFWTEMPSEQFYEIQEQVFRILDIIQKEENINKDFV